MTQFLSCPVPTRSRPDLISTWPDLDLTW